jgi:hypothetical protein
LGFGLPLGLSPPPEAPLWSARSVLDDVAAATRMDRDRLRRWDAANIDQLYREGVCGGALVSTRSAKSGFDAFVPLAHQSALAGIMLVVQLVTARAPELTAARAEASEGRLDVLRGLPQHLPRPRVRTPGCICSDNDYIERWTEKWHESGRTESAQEPADRQRSPSISSVGLQSPSAGHPPTRRIQTKGGQPRIR